MDYYLSYSNENVISSIVEHDESYNSYVGIVNLGIENGKYKLGKYYVGRCFGFISDDVIISIGLGKGLSEFLNDVRKIRRNFYICEKFSKFLEKYPNFSKATSPYVDYHYGGSTIFFNPNECVVLSCDEAFVKLEIDRDDRNNFKKIENYAIEVMRVVDKVAEEVKKMSPIDFSSFNFTPQKNEPSIRLPHWASNVVKVGTKVLTSFLGTSIPDFDFDFDGNTIDSSSIDNIDIGTIDLGEINEEGFWDIEVHDSELSNTEYNIPFGARNDGSYTKTSQDVNIQCASGANKGSYDVYLHNGQKYIDFQNQWVKIQGKTRFHLNGNDYIIK